MKLTRIAALLSAGALFVAGCGGSDTTENASAQAQTQNQNQPPGGGGGFMIDENLTKLADAIGVSKTKLEDAFKSIMPERPTGNDGTPPEGAPPMADGTPQAGGTPPAGGPPAGGPGGGDQLATQLAEKLGVSEDKVRDALAQVMPQRPQGSES